MSKQSPFAREDVMEAYLDSLLKEPEEDPGDVTARTSRLLEQAAQQLAESGLNVGEPLSIETPTTTPEVLVETPLPSAVEEIDIPSSLEVEDVENSDAQLIEDINEQAFSEVSEGQEGGNIPPEQKIPLKDTLDSRFQALFFEVAGLTLAVPLTTLGGIHQLDKVGPLFGKPDWFMGVMIHREEKINVVDSAKWVMPEKYDENLAQSLNYRYLIMLGDSWWGMACEKLVNTVTLTKADVKWRESVGKRPWLAGMVKEKMCALIDVSELISMLNKGLGSNDQTP